MNEANRSAGQEQELDFKRILLVLKKGWKWVLIVSVITLMIGFALATWVIHPVYASSTMLVVNAKTDQTTAATTITNDQVTTAQELVNTYSVILTSDTVLNQVISDLNLKMTTLELAKNISVEGVNQTQVLKITVNDTNPQLAKNIANDIASVAPNVIIRTVKAGSVEVVSTAKLELIPVFPKVPLFAAGGAAIGFLVTFLIFLIHDLLDNTFDSDEDVEKRLDISVIGIIPVVYSKK